MPCLTKDPHTYFSLSKSQESITVVFTRNPSKTQQSFIYLQGYDQSNSSALLLREEKVVSLSQTLAGPV